MVDAVALETLVREVVAQSCYLPASELRTDLKLAELGLDSLAVTSIVAELEAVCSCSVTPDEINTLFQAEDVKELIERIKGLVTAGEAD